ncbi:hypothetical protein PybrP1_008147 [[Pythium] brassicae (nom. inval.)]|nr:hypothetical protein PybrP1_008147 [[Pythium] brassicae (nom. inval.)]
MLLRASIAGVLLSLLLVQGTPATDADSELVLLVSLSRHGSRAPNPTAKTLCPNNELNLHAYQVPPEQLTERGMTQMEAAGRYVREVYVEQKKFLSPSFNSDDHSHFETYFRADAAFRCGQSAVSFGYGLYPDGTGPRGYAKQPIPVFMQLWESEHDFTANAPCFNVMKLHATHYAETRGEQLIELHADALNKAAELCGHKFFAANGDETVTAMKDVADMFDFDRDEGLVATPGLTPEVRRELSQLAFQNLIERLYSTPREITTTIGGFPQLLVRTLTDATTPSWSSANSTKYFSFHGHRELLHGLGFMLGMRFNFGEEMPAFNGSTSLYPATTLFFELHRPVGAAKAAPSDYFVKLFIWSPWTPRTEVKLDSCALECPLPQFSAIIETHLAQTGTWQDICNYHPVNAPRVLPAAAALQVDEDATAAKSIDKERQRQQDENASGVARQVLKASAFTHRSGGSDRSHGRVDAMAHWVLTAGGLAVLVALCVSTFQRVNKRREYLSL